MRSKDRIKSLLSPSVSILISLSAVPLLAGCVGNGGQAAASLPALNILASAESVPVGTANADAADDPAIWYNQEDPAVSMVVGTDKKAGLYVYDLQGKTKDFSPAGALNNVDLRLVDGLGGDRKKILVAASDRNDPAIAKIALFTLDIDNGKLSALGQRKVYPDGRSSAESYGFCLGAPRAAGELARGYVVLKDGHVVELALVPSDDQQLVATRYLRQFKLASQAEGCVVDDDRAMLYVGEEVAAIWKVDLSVDALSPVKFAEIGVKDGLVADIEGLALARRKNGSHWLVASSQGDNGYAVFDTNNGALIGRFRIASGGGADGAIGGTSETDGIDLVTGDFGSQYPAGLFVVQDGDNLPDAQNFKFVSWQKILDALGRADGTGQAGQ